MQIEVLSSNSTRAVFADLAARFAAASGHTLSIRYDPAQIMLRRIAAGETGDVALLGDTAIDALIAQGKIVASSRRALVRLGVGVGVRAGAPRPSIATVDEFKRMLLDAPSIAHTSEGASGMYFGALIEQLGIAAQVRAKTVTQPGGLVGELVIAGKAAVAIQQIPELLAVPGIVLAGALPAPVQKWTLQAAGMFASCAQPAAAQCLLDYLVSPPARAVFAARGFDLEPGALTH